MFSLSTVGKRIRQARKEAKLKQETLAETIDVVVQQISRYENSHDLPTISRLVAIAEATGKHPAFFLLEDGLSISSDEGANSVEKQEPRPVSPTEALKALKSLVYDTERLRRQLAEKDEELSLLRQPPAEPLEVLDSKNDSVTVMSDRRRRSTSSTSRGTGGAS